MALLLTLQKRWQKILSKEVGKGIKTEERKAGREDDTFRNTGITSRTKSLNYWLKKHSDNWEVMRGPPHYPEHRRLGKNFCPKYGWRVTEQGQKNGTETHCSSNLALIHFLDEFCWLNISQCSILGTSYFPSTVFTHKFCCQSFHSIPLLHMPRATSGVLDPACLGFTNCGCTPLPNSVFSGFMLGAWH